MKKNEKKWSAKPANEKTFKPGVKKVHNLIIVDESGSMQSLYSVALRGMNETMETIRQLAAECRQQAQSVTLVTFDSERYNTVFRDTEASKTREIIVEDYRPNACTPLYDALGKALTDLEPRVKENEAVLVTVITDGYENASTEYSLEDIRALVSRLDKAGWVFSYIGANQDSAEVGNSMGIKDTLDFVASKEDMEMMWLKERNARRTFIKESQCEDFNPQEYTRGNFFDN